jgi:type IV pilus assembly protein PilQ
MRETTAEGPAAIKQNTTEQKNPDPEINASFVYEEYASALNMIISGSGLQAKLVGRTIIVGVEALSSNTGRLASKIYRLNQASAKSAAQYLGSLGATIRTPRTFTTTESAQRDSSGGGGGSQSSTSTSTAIEAYGGGAGPLQGLFGTIDGRLGTITLVGQPNLVSVGEQYLKQIDLRQRQVALSIRILDITLDNKTDIDNSFAFRYGNNFIVNQQGQLVANFGALKPPSSQEGGLPGLFDGQNGSPIVGAGAFKLPGPGGPPFLNRLPPTSTTPFYDSSNQYRPSFGSYVNPGQPGLTGFTQGTAPVAAIPDRVIRLPDGGFQFIQGTPAVPGTPDTLTSGNPAAFQYPQNQFFDFVKAQVSSGSTKVLASPTLILSENSGEINAQESGAASFSGNDFLGGISTNNLIPGIGRSKANESAVVVGERIITGFNVQAGQNGAPNSCSPEFGIAGLTFGARVSKIDDNGFVTFSLSPTISAAGRQEFIQGCGNIRLLTLRSLDTGSARVRDGQTLILTGVISDRDLQLATKWPVLGDLPVVGQFFRNSQNGREKRELVVMVTPRIINDTEGGTYGYGYEPTSKDTRQFMTPSVSTPMPSAFPQP